jgi:hypothetical protein
MILQDFTLSFRQKHPKKTFTEFVTAFNQSDADTKDGVLSKRITLDCSMLTEWLRSRGQLTDFERRTIHKYSRERKRALADAEEYDAYKHDRDEKQKIEDEHDFPDFKYGHLQSKSGPMESQLDEFDQKHGSLESQIDDVLDHKQESKIEPHSPLTIAFSDELETMPDGDAEEYAEALANQRYVRDMVKTETRRIFCSRPQTTLPGLFFKTVDNVAKGLLKTKELLMYEVKDIKNTNDLLNEHEWSPPWAQLTITQRTPTALSQLLRGSYWRMNNFANLMDCGEVNIIKEMHLTHYYDAPVFVNIIDEVLRNATVDIANHVTIDNKYSTTLKQRLKYAIHQLSLPDGSKLFGTIIKEEDQVYRNTICYLQIYFMVNDYITNLSYPQKNKALVTSVFRELAASVMPLKKLAYTGYGALK